MAVGREDVIALVGEIDVEVVDRIVATGATLEEISLAAASLGFDDSRALAWSPRIVEVRALLERPLSSHEDNIERGRD
ncbi:MAG TPA: hypothetical protein VIV11_00105 [Kofleriaceae bacterium]